MLLTPEGRLLLTDFGLVKVISDNQSEQMRLTGAGAPVGTPDYMSPEQVIGGEVDGRADQYSLGVVLFQMLTGSTPFQGETPMQIASQQLHMTPPMPRTMRRDLPEAAERVLLRAMSKRPEERFASAQEFALAFCTALETAGVNITINRGLLSGSTATSLSAVRKGGLFDPRWQAAGPTTAMDSTQAQFPTATAQAPLSPVNEVESRPAGTGLLSKTGLFPRIGESTGAMQVVANTDAAPTGFFATGQMTTTNPRQPAFGQAAGFAADTGAQPLGTQSPFFTNSTGTLQQPFPTNAIQQLSPSTQSTTTAMSLLNAEQNSNNTIKITGQYVTGLLPVQQQQEAANLIAEQPAKRTSTLQKIILALILVVFLVGGTIGGVMLLRSRNNSPSAASNVPGTAGASPSAASVQATQTAQANILFDDPLTQNIHNFASDAQHFFKDNAYHIVDTTDNGAAMVVQQTFNYPSLAYQVTMEEIKGDESTTANTFGVLLNYNADKKNETFYSFEILNEGTNSQYAFYKYDKSKSYPWIQIGKSMKTGKEFHGGHGPKAVNTVKVVENNGAFTFYVNGQKVGTAKDTSLKPGSVGLLVNQKGTEVAFSDMLVTRN
jgi:serine/threonine protein kinase